MLMTRIVATSVMVLAWQNAFAQPYVPVHTIKKIPNWQCMELASDFVSHGDNAPPVPVYSGPAQDAPRVGFGAGVIIVHEPIQVLNGRTEMIWPNGRRVWIEADLLVAWHSLSQPGTVCHPALLSNGRYGWTTSN